MASTVGSVLDLRFHVEDAATVEYAAVPTIGFDLRIESGRREIRSLMLDVQVQIPARRRVHDPDDERLFDLFGDPSGWKDSLRTLPWMRTALVVPGFSGETVVQLPMPCSYDFEVTAARYLASLEDGEVPLEFMFYGTAFYAGPGGLLQTAHVDWSSEAEYRMPASVWHETMEHYFPRSAWLRVSKDTFDRLHAYRSKHALLSWERALDSLLDGKES
ncbi:MAG TPA: DUF6084 family protein [Thermoleophilaceae bacterium]